MKRYKFEPMFFTEDFQKRADRDAIEVVKHADLEAVVEALEIDSRFSDHWKLGFDMCKQRLLAELEGCDGRR